MDIIISSGRLLEDFNVYGIHGAGTGDISDSPPDGTDPEVGFSPKQTNKAENVCPWELDDNLIAKSKGDCKKATPGSSGGSVAGHVWFK